MSDPIIFDDENPEIKSAEGFRPAKEVAPEVVNAMKKMRGRPKSENPKKLISFRVDADVVDWLKSSGKGYQTRMNKLLRDIMDISVQ